MGKVIKRIWHGISSLPWGRIIHVALTPIVFPLLYLVMVVYFVAIVAVGVTWKLWWEQHDG